MSNEDGTESGLIHEVVDESPGGSVGDDVDALIEQAVDADGEYTLVCPSNPGGVPFYKFTPYRNNKEVRVHHWKCLVIQYELLPGKIFRAEPNILSVSDNDDYPLNHLSTEAIRNELRSEQHVQLWKTEDTPFDGPLFEYR